MHRWVEWLAEGIDLAYILTGEDGSELPLYQPHPPSQAGICLVRRNLHHRAPAVIRYLGQLRHRRINADAAPNYELLLARGADKLVKDNEGRRAVDLLAKSLKMVRQVLQ